MSFPHLKWEVLVPIITCLLLQWTVSVTCYGYFRRDLGTVERTLFGIISVAGYGALCDRGIYSNLLFGAMLLAMSVYVFLSSKRSNRFISPSLLMSNHNPSFRMRRSRWKVASNNEMHHARGIHMKPNLTDPGKVIITIATTGGLHGRESNAALPEQPKDIIQNFRDCYNAGATVAHMHVRDKRGVTTADLDVYGEVIEGVMSHCPGMITQVGNGIGLRYENPKAEGDPFTLEERMNLLNIRPQPDQLTLNLGTFHFEHKNTEFLFPNSKKWNAEFLAGCKKRGIRNELEVYDLSHIQNALDLVERGVLSRRCTSASCSASRAQFRQRPPIFWP